MSEAPENARYAIIAHVVHLVNRDYEVSPRKAVLYLLIQKSSEGRKPSVHINAPAMQLPISGTWPIVTSRRVGTSIAAACQQMRRRLRDIKALLQA